MTDQEQNKSMMDILSKMYAVNEGTYKASDTPRSGGDEVGEMYDVLKKLQEATGQSANTIVSETKTNPELGMAVNSTRTESGVTVSRYDIKTEKKTVQEGLSKTFYYIVDNRSEKILHDDIGLFESAMGVVKHLLYTDTPRKVDRILELDQEYVGAMMETYGYKQRLKRLDESTVQHDVVAAKYSNCRTKMSTAKMKLLKAI
jgi:hypothetical protein